MTGLNPSAEVNPDEAVAMGAAIQAAVPPGATVRRRSPPLRPAGR